MEDESRKINFVKDESRKEGSKEKIDLYGEGVQKRRN
jgi:hypothetical protein